MPGRIEPIIDWETEVVIVKLDQSSMKVLCLAQASRKLVCLELKMSGKDAHEEADDGRVGGGDVLEDDHEADQDRLAVSEAKGLVKGF